MHKKDQMDFLYAIDFLYYSLPCKAQLEDLYHMEIVCVTDKVRVVYFSLF